MTYHSNIRLENQSQVSTHNLELALSYARMGLPVFPAKDGSTRGRNGKADCGPWTGHGHLDATTDEKQIRRWWRRHPSAVPALPMGEASGLACLDLDRKGGKDGVAAIREAHGLDADTPPDGAVMVETPSGGRHLIFAHVAGLTNRASHLPDGCDVRAAGGWVVAPGAEDSRGTYTVLSGDLGLATMLDSLPRFPKCLLPLRREKAEPSPEPGDVDLAELQAALHHIPNDGTEEHWSEILRALCHATGGSDTGLAMALGWSASYSGFSMAEVRGKWRSYKRMLGSVETPLTAATIFAGAHKHGWGRITADSFKFDDGDDQEETAASRLTFLSPSECAAADPRPYVVKGLIGERDVGCIVVAPGVGKSLLAPAIAYSVAQGVRVFGRRVRQGGVFYVAAEDAHGMRGRVTALRNEHGDADKFKLVSGVSDLLSEGSADFRALREAVKRDRPSLVVIDTLAMAFPGLEENSAEGMGRVVAVARHLTKWGRRLSSSIMTRKMGRTVCRVGIVC